MSDRRRTSWLASGAALLLIASVSGIASAAPLVGDATTTTWVDANGNGVADVCETNVVADEAAVTTANQAADLDGDGTISTSEAAQTDWVGGTNCNHGGYVSTVAQGTEDATDANETDADAPTECEAPPTVEGATEVAVPLTHVEVAQSDAVGGKNCNHGGAVSESAKAAKAEREAARALKTHGHKANKHGKHGDQD